MLYKLYNKKTQVCEQNGGSETAAVKYFKKSPNKNGSKVLLVKRFWNTSTTTINITLYLEMTWSLLVEVGFRRTAACELWCGGRRVLWFRKKRPSCGWVCSQHTVSWGSCWMVEMCVVCSLLHSSFQLGAVFCIHLVFIIYKIIHKKTKNACYAQILPLIHQLYSPKKYIAELTIPCFLMLSFLLFLGYKQGCLC